MNQRILIVGGGPVGLSLAASLSLHSIASLVIDKNAEPQVWSKAAAVMPRTLEVLRATGVTDKLLPEGRPMHGFNIMRGDKQLGHIDIRLEGPPYPYIFGIEQRKTELLLAEHLKDAAGADFQREVELVSFEQRDDRVVAKVRDDSGEHDIAARYMDAVVARVMQIPPSLLNTESQHSLTYSTVAGEFQRWLTVGLHPMFLSRIEAAYTELLPRGQRAEFDTSPLTRLDMTTLETGQVRVNAND